MTALPALVAMPFAPEIVSAETLPALRVGLLEFGTASWITDTVIGEGLDVAAGYRLEPVRIASNEAARIAFQSEAIDTLVSDLLFAARSTADGRPVIFEPFSSSEGALVVPAASPIRTIGDLKGKRLGVAGGPLDKSWLLLRGACRRDFGLDLTTAVEPLFGAPPLLSRKLETGELDALLTVWSFAARLEAKGCRRIVDVGGLARAFGATGPIALLGWLFRRDFAEKNAGLVDRFIASVGAARRRLERDAGAWARIRPAMRAEDEATFVMLKTRFLDGAPVRRIVEEEKDAIILYRALAEIGGEALVGPAKSLPADLYRAHADGG